MSRSRAPASDPVQFSIAPPEKTVFGGPAAGGTGRAPQVAISPDGRNIVFVAGAPPAFQIWLRPVASAEARPILGTEGGAFPFWSPDSQFVAFFAGGKLKKVAIAGGPPVELTDAATGRGGSWSRDNVIVFDRASGLGLFRVSSGGGVPTAVTALADGEDAHRWPHFLPDGRHFFYTAVTGTCCPPTKPGTIKIGSLDQNEPTLALIQADSSATYAFNRVLFARDQTLMALAFDPDRRQTAGDAVPVIAPVSTEGSRYVSASVSENGTLVYAPGGSLNTQLTWFDRAGKILGTLGEGWLDVNLSLSPDERQVALALRSGSRRISISGPSTSPATREPRDDRCETRRVACVVAEGHKHRVLKRRARPRRTAGEGAPHSDAGQRHRGQGSPPRSRRDSFTAMRRATMHTPPDRLVRRRTFRVVHVQRDVSGDVGHLGPSALWGAQTVFRNRHGVQRGARRVFAGRPMDRVCERRNWPVQRLRSAISSRRREASDLTEWRTKPALAGR